MGHDVGQGRGHYKTAQIDHAGTFSHNHQHFIGQAPRQSGFGKYQADDNGTENKQYRRVHKIFKRLIGGPDQKQYLKNADHQGRDADGNHFKDPPGAGQQKDGQRSFSLLR